MPGVDGGRGAHGGAPVASLGDETPEGRSIVELARERAAIEIGRRRRRRGRLRALGAIVEFIAFTAEARASGVRLTDGSTILKGAVDAIRDGLDGTAPAELATVSRRDRRPRRHAAGDQPPRSGHSALIELKDTVKPGLAERFAELRRMGIRTIMITGDNPLTAATIAARGRRRRLRRRGQARGEDRDHPRASRRRATWSR